MLTKKLKWYSVAYSLPYATFSLLFVLDWYAMDIINYYHVSVKFPIFDIVILGAHFLSLVVFICVLNRQRTVFMPEASGKVDIIQSLVAGSVISLPMGCLLLSALQLLRIVKNLIYPDDIEWLHRVIKDVYTSPFRYVLHAVYIIILIIAAIQIALAIIGIPKQHKAPQLKKPFMRSFIKTIFYMLSIVAYYVTVFLLTTMPLLYLRITDIFTFAEDRLKMKILIAEFCFFILMFLYMLIVAAGSMLLWHLFSKYLKMRQKELVTGLGIAMALVLYFSMLILQFSAWQFNIF